jgi:deoxyribodipyrimidine photo-lyase
VLYFKQIFKNLRQPGDCLTAATAKKAGVPLICLFVCSPQNYEANLASTVGVDLELRTLGVMKKDLTELDTPLHVITRRGGEKVPEYNGVSREMGGSKTCSMVSSTRSTSCDKGNTVHDNSFIPPRNLCTSKGKQYAVYTPWSRSLIKHVNSHPEPLEASQWPRMNPPETKGVFREVFDLVIPNAPENKRLSDEERGRYVQLRPAGEHEVMKVHKFVAQRIGRYADTRNFPAANSTAIISVQHSVGALAAARDAKNAKKIDRGNTGIMNWISEVAWRDFYKRVLAHWLHVCLHEQAVQGRVYKYYMGAYR